MSELKPEPMHQYEVVINGVVHTFQMDAEDAKRYPGAKKVGRSQVSLVDPVATSGQQVHEGSTSRAAGQAAVAPCDERLPLRLGSKRQAEAHPG